jgi:hypothetical protein
VNAAFLIMSSAALTGADPVPVQHHPAAPVVVSPGAGYNPCCAPAPTCCESKPGLFDRFKSRFGKKSKDCCTPACPPPCPAPCPPPAPVCNPCDTGCAPTCNRPNLLDKMKGWWGGRKNRNGPCCDPCPPPCAPTCDPCAGAPIPGHPGYPAHPGIPGTPGTPSTPPKEMPKPKDKVPEKPKGDTSAPQPRPSGAPAVRGTSPY